MGQYISRRTPSAAQKSSVDEKKLGCFQHSYIERKKDSPKSKHAVMILNLKFVADIESTTAQALVQNLEHA